jgi:hypothetical protein
MEEQPLFFGRLLRILSGLALFAWLAISPPVALFWRSVLVFLGLSLVVGGMKAYPGCEIWALPNLLLRRRMQCF